MKIKNLLKLVLTISALFSFSVAEAALKEYKIELGTEKPVVGESYDLTITSLDEDGNTVEDNTDTVIIFSDSEDVEIPESLTDESYEFKASDKWVVKFENAIKFNKEGTQSLYVISQVSEEDIEGILEIEVLAEAAQVEEKDISITEPVDGITIGTNEVKVSGKTEKSHKVVVKINDTEIETTSDGEGVFSVSAKELADGDNAISATIYDAEDNTIGTSETVTIKSSSEAPTFDGVTLDVDGVVEPGTKIEITALADAGLDKVEVYFNDDVIALKEGEEGAYTGSVLAPEKEGEYVMDIVLTNDLTLETKESGVASITVKAKEVEPAVEPVKPEPVVEPVEPKNLPAAEPASTKPTNIKVTKYNTKTLLTWNKVADAESYNIYKKDKSGELNLIDTTKENRYIIYISGKEVTFEDFYIKAVIKKGEETLEGELSDMTKVQTGPAEIMLVLMLAMLVAYMVMRRREAK